MGFPLTNEKQEQIADMMDVLAQIEPSEVGYVLKQLRRGRIDGGTYVAHKNTCGCLFGAVGEARGLAPFELTSSRSSRAIQDQLMIKQHPAEIMRPAEILFIGIDLGDRPYKGNTAKLVESFILELMYSNRRVFKNVSVG